MQYACLYVNSNSFFLIFVSFLLDLGFLLANSLDSDQARQKVASDLELYCLTLFINYVLHIYTCIHHSFS